MLLLLREPAPERNRVWSGDELNSSLYLFVALYYSFFSYTRDNISPLENEPYHLLSRFLTVSNPYNIAGLTPTLYTFPFTLAGTLLSQITPDILLHPFHTACTLFFTSLPHSPLLCTVETSYGKPISHSKEHNYAMVQAAEPTTEQMHVMSSEQAVSAVHPRGNRGHQDQQGCKSRGTLNNHSNFKCKNISYEHAPKKCPAFGKECHTCRR